MKQLSKIETFWQDYLSTLSEVDQRHTPRCVVDQFAGTPEAATKVGKLVRDEIKTTTSSDCLSTLPKAVPLMRALTVKTTSLAEESPPGLLFFTVRSHLRMACGTV